MPAGANASQLMQYSTGLSGTPIVGANGQIIGHAGLQNAFATIAAPLIIFQILSMVTGQYYKNRINKMLRILGKDIEFIKNWLVNEKEAELIVGFHIVENFSKRNFVTPEDIMQIEHLRYKNQELLSFYMLTLKGNIERLFASDEEGYLTSTKIESLEDAFESEISFYIRKTLIAHRLYVFTIMSQLKIHSMMLRKQPEWYDERLQKIKELTAVLANVECDKMTVDLLNLLDSAKKLITGRTKKIVQDAWIDEDIAEQLKNKNLNRIENFKNEYFREIKEWASAYKEQQLILERQEKNGISIYVSFAGGKVQLFQERKKEIA